MKALGTRPVSPWSPGEKRSNRPCQLLPISSYQPLNSKENPQLCVLCLTWLRYTTVIPSNEQIKRLSKLPLSPLKIKLEYVLHDRTVAV